MKPVAKNPPLTKLQERLRKEYMDEHGKLTQLQNLERFLDTCIDFQARKVGALNYRYRRAMGWDQLVSKFDIKDTLSQMVEKL